MSARKLVGFWDVEGVPVVEFGFTDSGGGFVAVDSDKARLFPGDSAYRNGVKVSEDRFAELFPEAVPRIAAALSFLQPADNSAPLPQMSEWMKGLHAAMTAPGAWAEAIKERENDQQPPNPYVPPTPPKAP